MTPEETALADAQFAHATERVMAYVTLLLSMGVGAELSPDAHDQLATYWASIGVAPMDQAEANAFIGAAEVVTVLRTLSGQCDVPADELWRVYCETSALAGL